MIFIFLDFFFIFFFFILLFVFFFFFFFQAEDCIRDRDVTGVQTCALPISATGIREGARTGLAAVVTGLLFAATLFFVPLVQPLQKLQFAYGPALMVVGVLMFGAVRHLRSEERRVGKRCRSMVLVDEDHCCC